MDKLYITKSIRSVIADKDTGKCISIWLPHFNKLCFNKEHLVEKQSI